MRKLFVYNKERQIIASLIPPFDLKYKSIFFLKCNAGTKLTKENIGKYLVSRLPLSEREFCRFFFFRGWGEREGGQLLMNVAVHIFWVSYWNIYNIFCGQLKLYHVFNFLVFLKMWTIIKLHSYDMKCLDINVAYRYCLGL